MVSIPFLNIKSNLFHFQEKLSFGEGGWWRKTFMECHVIFIRKILVTGLFLHSGEAEAIRLMAEAKARAVKQVAEAIKEEVRTFVAYCPFLNIFLTWRLHLCS